MVEISQQTSNTSYPLQGCLRSDKQEGSVERHRVMHRQSGPRTVAADLAELIHGVIDVAAGGKVDPRPKGRHALMTLSTSTASEVEALDAMKMDGGLSRERVTVVDIPDVGHLQPLDHLGLSPRPSSPSPADAGEDPTAASMKTGLHRDNHPW